MGWPFQPPDNPTREWVSSIFHTPERVSLMSRRSRKGVADLPHSRKDVDGGSPVALSLACDTYADHLIRRRCPAVIGGPSSCLQGSLERPPQETGQTGPNTPEALLTDLPPLMARQRPRAADSSAPRTSCYPLRAPCSEPVRSHSQALQA